MEFDYTVKDITSESDMILSRWTQEYPKLNNKYTRKDIEEKPWG